MDLSYVYVGALLSLLAARYSKANLLIKIYRRLWPKFQLVSSHAGLLRLVSLQASIRDLERIGVFPPAQLHLDIPIRLNSIKYSI
jgi:hypothetical protein